MVYIGIPDKLVLVIDHNGIGCVAEGYNKDKLYRLRSHARKTELDNKKLGYTDVEGREVVLQNNNLCIKIPRDISITDAGVLCGIYTEETEVCKVNIDTNSLLRFIASNTVINGDIYDGVRLGFNAGSVGVYNSKCYDWGICRLEGKLKKTSKWEIGREYMSKTLGGIYIGNIKCGVEIHWEYRDRKRKATIKILKESKEERVLVEIGRDVRDKIHNGKISTIEELVDSVDKKEENSGNIRWVLNSCINKQINRVNKKASMMIGEIKLDGSTDIIRDSIIAQREKILNSIEMEKRISSDLVTESILGSIHSGESGVDREFIEKVINAVDLDIKIVEE